MQVNSSEGVIVAIHELSPWSVPDHEDPRRALMMSHASGFHGGAWQPVADQLAHRYRCLALDYRGHGATAVQPGWQVEWERYGDDAEVSAEAIAEVDPGGRLLAVGHSMGGACLLIAAARRPELFRGLVLFEPIVFPTEHLRSAAGNPLAQGARRRRRRFATLAEAEANYAAKPPLSSFTSEARWAYVRGGLRPTPQGDVELACDPEIEAATFETGTTHRTWEVLPAVDVPVLVIAGAVEAFQPSALARPIAQRLPQGRYVELPQLDHFAPMVEPGVIAQLIIDFDQGLADR